MPILAFWLLTGGNCPVCDALRMTHDLLHPDPASAVTDNVFVVVGIPALARWVMTRRRCRRTVLPVSAFATVAVATPLSTVARNLPGFLQVRLWSPVGWATGDYDRRS